MAIPITLLNLDDSIVESSVAIPSKGTRWINSWQLLKKPTAAQTAFTAAQLSQDIRDVDCTTTPGGACEFLNVRQIVSLKIQAWGVATNADSNVLDFYGWDDHGPGMHIGKLTLNMGNFTSAALTGFHASAGQHISIRNNFDPGAAQRGCDSFTVTNDYELAFKSFTSEAAFPAFVSLNLDTSQYTWIGALLTTKAAGTTNLGLICRATGQKSNGSPDGKFF